MDHSGEVNGFVSIDTLYPAQGVAIAVLINAETSTGGIEKAIETVLFAPAAKAKVPPDAAVQSQVKSVLEGLESGTLDRARLTDNLKFFFTAQVIADYKASLAGLGKIKKMEGTSEEERGGMQGYFYEVHGAGKSVGVFLYVMPDGRLDQFLLEKLE